MAAVGPLCIIEDHGLCLREHILCELLAMPVGLRPVVCVNLEYALEQCVQNTLNLSSSSKFILLDPAH